MLRGVGTGNILDSDCAAIINTINCQGVMGKGLALQVKQRWPGVFLAYYDYCMSGKMKPGGLFTILEEASGKVIVNFATKNQWRNPSRLEWIRKGLDSLVDWCVEKNIASVACPPLGCGNGGLIWAEVKPLILAAAEKIPGRILLYEPVKRIGT